MGLKMNIAKTKVTVVDNTPINGKEPGQRDTTKNHGRLGGICQTQFEYNDMFLCCCSLLFLPIFLAARDGEDAIVADADGAAAFFSQFAIDCCQIAFASGPPQVEKVGSHTYPPPPSFTFLAVCVCVYVCVCVCLCVRA